MPKEIDPKVKERCVQQMLDHVAENRSNPDLGDGQVSVAMKKYPLLAMWGYLLVAI